MPWTMRTEIGFLSLLLLWLVSCTGNTSTERDRTVNTANKDTVKTVAISKEQDVAIQSTDELEVFAVDHMLFNGRLKRFCTLDEFDTVFGQPDSTKLLSEEEPCSYIFENEDGSKDPGDRYLYKYGSRFENSGKKVAVDEFRFDQGNFIRYGNITLDAATTIDDLRKIFPNAVRAMGTIDVYGAGTFQLIHLREDKDNVSDGHIRIFIRNGRLYAVHWWFPC